MDDALRGEQDQRMKWAARTAAMIEFARPLAEYAATSHDDAHRDAGLACLAAIDAILRVDDDRLHAQAWERLAVCEGTIDALRDKLEALRVATDCDAAELEYWKARCLRAEKNP